MMGSVYLWLKAFHVIAVLAFVGGLTMAALGLVLLAEKGNDVDLARRIRRWDRLFTSPALIATWAFGITLATTGNWFTQGWLQLKFVLVLVLSALHGIQSGYLRRVIEGRAPSGRMLRPAPVLFCVAAIAFLAVLKPG